MVRSRLAAASVLLACLAIAPHLEALPRQYGVKEGAREPSWCTRSFELPPGGSETLELDVHWPTVIHATIRCLAPGGRSWWKRRRITRGRLDPPVAPPLTLKIIGPGTNVLRTVSGETPLHLSYRVGREGLDCGSRFKVVLENPGHMGYAIGTMRVTYREAPHHAFLRKSPTS